MSENRGPRRGPMGHGRMGGEKAKDFKGTMGKLIKYMSAFKIQMLFVVIFAIGGTVFNIIGPKILGKATTEIFNGLVSKVSGGSGMDFEKIATILLTALALYVTSALCSLVQGFLMTGVSQKTTYRLRKEISQKINRMPMMIRLPSFCQIRLIRTLHPYHSVLSETAVLLSAMHFYFSL